MSLINMNLLKIFFLNIIIFIVAFHLYPETKVQLFRSNSNGLQLIEIDEAQKDEFKFTLYVYTTDELLEKKVLYKENLETKKWEYKYNGTYLSHEKYYKDQLITAEYRYDSEGHKIKQVEYKNNNKIKVITFRYNEDGLVDREEIINLVNNTTINVKYRYDRLFRIKQIEKRHPDGNIVYWEAFFTDKGIIQKEHYTLEDERYTFWYNKYGQEVKGEIRTMDGMKEGELKKEWISTYTKKGRKDKKEEINYDLNQSIKTWYNSSFKEIRVELYKDDSIFSIDIYDYDEDNRMIFHEYIQDLNSEKKFYKYNENGDMVKSAHYVNDKLKKMITFYEDGTRKEVFYGKNNKKIEMIFDSEDRIISNDK